MQLTLGALALASLASAATHMVQVAKDSQGNPALAYDPPVTVAQPGDSVVFQFHPPKHSVTQSTGSEPCIPMEDGFFSTFFTTTGNANPKEFVITINDTKPIWFYCAFEDHCELGMVGAINVPMNDFTTFMQAASKVPKSGVPSPVNVAIGGIIQAAGAPVVPPTSSLMMSSAKMESSKAMPSPTMASSKATPIRTTTPKPTTMHAPASNMTVSSSGPSSPTNFPGNAAGSNSIAGWLIAFAVGICIFGM